MNLKLYVMTIFIKCHIETIPLLNRVVFVMSTFTQNANITWRKSDLIFNGRRSIFLSFCTADKGIDQSHCASARYNITTGASVPRRTPNCPTDILKYVWNRPWQLLYEAVESLSLPFKMGCTQNLLLLSSEEG